MQNEPFFVTYLTGNIPGDSPCLCMRCPECRGYVMDMRRPVDPKSNLRDWKPSARDIEEQARAMEVVANEGRPAVLARDAEVAAGSRWKKKGEHSDKRKPRATSRLVMSLDDKIARMDAELNKLKGGTG